MHHAGRAADAQGTLGMAWQHAAHGDQAPLVLVHLGHHNAQVLHAPLQPRLQLRDVILSQEPREGILLQTEGCDDEASFS